MMARAAKLSSLDSLFALAMVVGCLAVFMPFSPYYPEATLDPGWAYGLNTAVEKGFVFGRDIIFTFGPYASAYSWQYHPATDTRMLLSTGLLGLAFSMGFLVVTRGRNRLLLLLATPLLLALFSPIADPLFFCNSLVFLIVVSRIALPPSHLDHIPTTPLVYVSLTLSTLALGLLPLIKGSFGLASFAIGGLGCLILVIGGLNLLAASSLALFAIAISSFWVLAGQPLSLLPQFFLAQAPIISGYTDAMSLPGPAREPIFYVVATIALSLCYSKFVRSGGLVGTAFAVGVGLLLFLGFKAGFVRHDGHAYISAGILALTGWILFASFPRTSSAVAVICCFVCWAIIFNRLYPAHLSLASAWDRATSSILKSVRGLTERVADGQALQRKYDSHIADIRKRYTLPPLEGTADVYSHGQSILIANGLDWKPRPVLQSYSAYTPSLIEKNARNLDGEAPPRNILFNIESIDGRFPPLEDGLSWLTLLTRYQPVALQESMAILRLRDNERPGDSFSLTSVSSGTYQFGKEITLSSAGTIQWAKLKVRPTLLGKFFALAYKPPRLKIRLRLPNNSTREFRYIAEMGETGFIVSPIVERTEDFIALGLPNKSDFFPEAFPLSMSIITDTWSERFGHLLWNPEFSVELSRLDIPAQPGASKILLDPIIAVTDARNLSMDKTAADNCWVDEINGRPLQDSRSEARHVLRIRGWAGFSIKDGIAPEKTVVRLTGPHGEVQHIPARIIARDDVNRHFNQPNMGKIGYAAVSDVSEIAGTYHLSLEVTAAGKTRICENGISISIAP